MAVISISSVLTLISAGVYPITVGTLKFFGREQQEKRRYYPSIEVVEVKNASTTETQQNETRQRVFEVRVYQKLKGGLMDTEVADQGTIENTIFSILDGAILEDHKLVINDKQWNKTYFQTTHPHYIKSVLRVQTTLKNVAINTDGILTFQLSSSSVDNPPAGNYTYSRCFNTVFDEGYGTIEEPMTQNPNGIYIPAYFTGRYSAPFVTNIYVNKNDLGTTGEKLNKLNQVRSNGTKPIVSFVYTDFDSEFSPATISETFKIIVDKVKRQYQTMDVTVYMLTGRLVQPSVIGHS